MAKSPILQERYELAKKVMQDPKHTQAYIEGWRKMENDKLVPILKRRKMVMDLSKALRDAFKVELNGLSALAKKLKAIE